LGGRSAAHRTSQGGVAEPTFDFRKRPLLLVDFLKEKMEGGVSDHSSFWDEKARKFGPWIVDVEVAGRR
jgi:hypothetical protein